MKKFKFQFVVFFSVILIFACNEKKEQAEPSNDSKNTTVEQKSQSPNQRQDKITVLLNPELGQKFTYKNYLYLTMKQKYDTVSSQSKMNNFSTFSLKVTEKTPDYVRFNITFEQFAVEISNDFQRININTAQPSSNPSLTETFLRKCVGRNFYIKVNTKTKEIELSGLDTLVKNLQNSLSKTQDFANVDKQMVDNLINSIFSEENLKSSYQKMFDFYPSTPITIGNTWERQQTVQEPLPLKVNNVYTVSSIVNDTVFLSTKAKLDFLKNELPKEVKLLNVSGNQSGEIKLNRKNGLVIMAAVKQNIKTSHELTNPMEQNKKVTITTEITSTNKIELQ